MTVNSISLPAGGAELIKTLEPFPQLLYNYHSASVNAVRVALLFLDAKIKPEIYISHREARTMSSR